MGPAELEQALAALARELEFPATPDLAGRTAARLDVPARRPLRLRRLALVLALLLAAVGIAFAVPPARTAILRFLGLGGVTVVRVDALPPAQERPLAATLGTPASAERVERDLGFRFLLPPTEHPPRLYESSYGASVLLAAPQPVLLTELRSDGGPALLKKLASGGTLVEPVEVGGAPGLWLSGPGHVVLAPAAPPRLAGNVLLWQRGDVTLRLEGRLTKAAALRLARSVGPR